MLLLSDPIDGFIRLTLKSSRESPRGNSETMSESKPDALHQEERDREGRTHVCQQAAVII